MLLASSQTAIGLLLLFLVFIPSVIGVAALVTWLVVSVSNPERKSRRREAQLSASYPRAAAARVAGAGAGPTEEPMGREASSPPEAVEASGAPGAPQPQVPQVPQGQAGGRSEGEQKSRPAARRKKRRHGR